MCSISFWYLLHFLCVYSIHPVQSIRDLGVYVDGAMTTRTHINHVLSSCFSALRQIKSIKRSLLAHALSTMVTTCTVGLTTVMSYSLVSQTATFSACNPFSTRPFVWSPARPGGTTSLSLLRDHHWLSVKQQIEYKLCMTTSLPAWRSTTLSGRPHHAVCRATARAGFRSATFGSIAVPRTMPSLGDRSFAVAAPHAWNKLPSPLC